MFSCRLFHHFPKRGIFLNLSHQSVKPPRLPQGRLATKKKKFLILSLMLLCLHQPIPKGRRGKGRGGEPKSKMSSLQTPTKPLDGINIFMLYVGVIAVIEAHASDYCLGVSLGMSTYILTHWVTHLKA
jgi:hypothetical protein